jgi:hypothetical protein
LLNKYTNEKKFVISIWFGDGGYFVSMWFQDK